MKRKRRSYYDGSLKKLPSGRWRMQISLGQSEDGTRKRLSKTFDTQKDAIDWKNKMYTIKENYGQDSIITSNSTFIERYSDWLLTFKKSEVYSRQFKVLMQHYHSWIKPYFFKIKEKDIFYKHMQAFFKHLERKNVGLETRRKIKCELHQYFEFSYRGTPMRNPLDIVKILSTKKIEMLDGTCAFNSVDYKAVPKEIRQEFLTALDQNAYSSFLKPLCYLMYFTGNRIGEALAYQWKDFNFERRYFLVYKSLTIEYDFDENGNTIGRGKTIVKTPKTENGIRPLPLLDILYEVLYEWYEKRLSQEKITGISFTAPDDYIFATDMGHLRTEGGTYTIFQRFLKRYNLHGKGIHFQALRQTFSNSLFANGAGEQIIEDIMGHASISTTKKHYKTLQKFDSVQEAARQFNALYQPKNKKYKAGKNVTFAPEGYITEEEAIQKVSPNLPKKTKDKKNKEEELVQFLGDLKEIDPKLFKRLKEIVSE